MKIDTSLDETSEVYMKINIMLQKDQHPKSRDYLIPYLVKYPLEVGLLINLSVACFYQKNYQGSEEVLD
jgi:hypothetical protein